MTPGRSGEAAAARGRVVAQNVLCPSYLSVL